MPRALASATARCSLFICVYPCTASCSLSLAMSRSSASVLCLSCSYVNSAIRSSYSVLFYFCKDLIEMMSQVVHVVADQVFECGRDVFVHEIERNLVQRVTRACFGQNVFGYH